MARESLVRTVLNCTESALKSSVVPVPWTGVPAMPVTPKKGTTLTGLVKLIEKVAEQVSFDFETSKAVRKNKRLSDSHRIPYIVRDGDTIESIAQKLGDVRFLNLIVTINRVRISQVSQGEVLVPVVYPAQEIWLPSQVELNVYRRNFFSTKAGRAIDGSKVQTQILSEPRRPEECVRKPLPEFRFNSKVGGVPQDTVSPETFFDATPSINGSGKRLADILKDVRFSGHRVAVDLDRATFRDERILNRRCYQVRSGETLPSIALHDAEIKDVRVWKLIAKLNGLSSATDEVGQPVATLARGQILVLPTVAEVNEYILFDKLFSTLKLQPVQSRSKTDAALDAEGSDAELLSPFCKLVRDKCETPGGTVFGIRLCAFIMSNWTVLVAYDCSRHGSARTIIHRDGRIEILRFDLPDSIARQMACEDFRRNWHLYYNSYFTQSPSSKTV